MATIVAITGTQGTGKSTLTDRLRGICEAAGSKVVVVDEVADRCPYPLNEDTSTEAQRWIWREQIIAELRARKEQPDVIICDRSVMCNLCYLALVNHVDAKGAFDELYGISYEWMCTQYDYIVRLSLNEVWLQSGNNPKRSADLDFARKIDTVMDNLVQRHVNIESDALIELLGSVEHNP